VLDPERGASLVWSDLSLLSIASHPQRLSSPASFGHMSQILERPLPMRGNSPLINYPASSLASPSPLDPPYCHRLALKSEKQIRSLHWN